MLAYGVDMNPVIDAHIHIQPFHMMTGRAAARSGKKANRAELEGLRRIRAKLLRQMDADGIERVGLINYVSPDVMGFTSEVNEWMMRYASADPSRLIPFGSVHPRFTDDVGGETDRIIELGARALKVHPPHQMFRANAYQDELPRLAELYAWPSRPACPSPSTPAHRSSPARAAASAIRWTWTTWRSIFRS